MMKVKNIVTIVLAIALSTTGYSGPTPRNYLDIGERNFAKLKEETAKLEEAFALIVTNIAYGKIERDEISLSPLISYLKEVSEFINVVESKEIRRFLQHRPSANEHIAYLVQDVEERRKGLVRLRLSKYSSTNDSFEHTEDSRTFKQSCEGLANMASETGNPIIYFFALTHCAVYGIVGDTSK